MVVSGLPVRVCPKAGTCGFESHQRLFFVVSEGRFKLILSIIIYKLDIDIVLFRFVGFDLGDVELGDNDLNGPLIQS